MKTTLIFIVASLALFITCKPTGKENKTAMSSIDTLTVKNVSDSLIRMYGTENKFRIERGVMQTAKFWTSDDGDIKAFSEFCRAGFIADSSKLDKLFRVFERNFEIINGNLTKLSLQLREPLELDLGEINEVDMLFGSYNPASHLDDDLFKNKLAFNILLNFPFYTLEEKAELGRNWTRKDWAYAVLGESFTSRVPADIIQNYSTIATKNDAYIADYNIYMGNLIDNENNSLFPKDLKLITHWGLRDELKSHYAEPEGIKKQQMIYAVMNRIITQEIPADVINKDEFTWNPETNKVFKEGKEIEFVTEKNARYQHLLDIFKASEKIDNYYPYYPTAILRAFDEDMQMTLEEVEKLFVELLSSEQVKKVAELIKKDMGRDLEPFDIWYSRFKPDKGTYSEAELDKIVSSKYPDKGAFEKELPVILTKLGFTKEKAAYITSKVTVDPSRGAGHATGAEMRTDKSHLRTRIAGDGMNYKGYNIAVHEFGHNVEQTLSLYDIDYYSLHGVPNTAFTEALAFVFQQRDLDLLGIKEENSNAKDYLALDIFWMSYEIMGVSLVDMAVWKWLYENPNADADQLKEAVLTIAKDIWNKYYADIFGVRDQVILGIYSHMIAYPLYLSAYPVGHLISYQIEEFMADKKPADEIERIFTIGSITPEMWMINAVGNNISNRPLLNAVDIALQNLKK